MIRLVLPCLLIFVNLWFWRWLDLSLYSQWNSLTFFSFPQFYFSNSISNLSVRHWSFKHVICNYFALSTSCTMNVYIAVMYFIFLVRKLSKWWNAIRVLSLYPASLLLGTTCGLSCFKQPDEIVSLYFCRRKPAIQLKKLSLVLPRSSLSAGVNLYFGHFSHNILADFCNRN